MAEKRTIGSPSSRAVITYEGALSDRRTAQRASLAIQLGVIKAAALMEVHVKEAANRDTPSKRGKGTLGPVFNNGIGINSIFAPARAEINGTVTQAAVGTPLGYMQVMDQGRGKRRPGPPFAPILLWVRRKLGLTGAAAESRAAAVRHSIHVNGIEGRFFMDRGFMDGTPGALAILEQATREFTIHWDGEAG